MRMEPSSEASRSALQGQEQPQHHQQEGSPPPSPLADPVDNEPDPEAATTHLARFEFSSDDGGTKVLMVEWHPGAAGAATTPKSNDTTGARTSSTAGDADRDGWDIAWPGKSTNLPANDSDQSGSRRRVFFLLPPDAAIPTTVTITPTGGGGSAEGRIEVKPLPAIFPEGFDRDAGSRGVLHTLWARRRVAELEREMEAEMKTNTESVGLEMALGEKQWIVDNFLSRPTKKPTIVVPSTGEGTFVMPLSPRSPSGRLGEKLRGLKLATTPADLVPSPTANTFFHTTDPASEGSDIAVSSLSAISQSNRVNETASLDAALKGQAPASAIRPNASRDEEDDLFALPMSPRSPEMTKSPFSMLK